MMISWFKPKSLKHPKEIQVPQLRFLGEQLGAPESDLKCRLGKLFQRNQSVIRAYLARIVYDDQSPEAVALCLRGQLGPDRGMAQKIGNIFASMFGIHEHLDIVFLTDEQDHELAKICQPFFGDLIKN